MLTELEGSLINMYEMMMQIMLLNLHEEVNRKGARSLSLFGVTLVVEQAPFSRGAAVGPPFWHRHWHTHTGSGSRFGES